MINMKLLPIIFLNYSANREWEYSNLSGSSCGLDHTSNSHNWFTKIFVAARGENQQTDLGVKGLTTTKPINLILSGMELSFNTNQSFF